MARPASASASAASGLVRTHITDAHKTFDSGDHGSDLRNLLFEQFSNKLAADVVVVVDVVDVVDGDAIASVSAAFFHKNQTGWPYF